MAQIFLPVELQRIDEDADNQARALAARPVDQPGMTGVQRSHCRNQTDWSSLTPASSLLAQRAN